ncbi:CatB-related O-acetyltransferase [Vibrio sp. 10N.247.311.59]|uniref:CatB-related O-acetyltransferase n=1 Tax=Vibrio sp. 10N.247.311.59 TaxID=3229989 RepID=UPI00354BD51E
MKLIRKILSAKRILTERKKNVVIRFGSSFNKKTFFEGHNSIKAGSSVSNSYIGRGTYIGSNCILKNVKIGRFCSIASNVSVLSNDHPVKGYVSTHPAFHKIDDELMCLLQLNFKVDKPFKPEFITESNHNVNIGSDVWVGEGVRILPGVNIGNGAIIAARALVTKDVDNYAIVGGIPAKLIRYRFNKNEVDSLMNINWWNWNLEKIKQNSTEFICIDRLEQCHKNVKG